MTPLQQKQVVGGGEVLRLNLLQSSFTDPTLWHCVVVGANYKLLETPLDSRDHLRPVLPLLVDAAPRTDIQERTREAKSVEDSVLVVHPHYLVDLALGLEVLQFTDLQVVVLGVRLHHVGRQLVRVVHDLGDLLN